MNKLSSSRNGAVMFRSYRESGCRSWCAMPASLELGFNMSLCVFDKGWGRLLILLLASILQSTLAASQQSSAPASTDSSHSKFLTRWVKRGLRDQADIYTAPLDRSEMKWVIGLPVVTAGLIV